MNKHCACLPVQRTCVRVHMRLQRPVLPDMIYGFGCSLKADTLSFSLWRVSHFHPLWTNIYVCVRARLSGRNVHLRKINCKKKKKKMYTCCVCVCSTAGAEKGEDKQERTSAALRVCVRAHLPVCACVGSKRTAVHILQVGYTWRWTAGSPIKQRVKESEHTGHYEVGQ